MATQIEGKLVDVHSRSIYPARIFLEDGRITDIKRIDRCEEKFIVPGFVDAHIHIESSLLIPKHFAEVALTHGTIATVSDPHEIANVCGVEGVDFMIRDGRESKLKFHWTAPSCVPATYFETAGANLGINETEVLLKKKEVVALGEMMNYPGVIFKNEEVLGKIGLSHKYAKPVDGHAPGLSGADLKTYANSGISTDHECASLEEALEKISLGMKILIREGSSAKNFDALCSLLNTHPDLVMLCSDDLHADDLLAGHLNLLVKRALHVGVSMFNVLRAVSVNPVFHYNLPVGLLRVNDPGDFLIVDNLNDFTILQTWVNGEIVYSKGIIRSEFVKDSDAGINHFNASIVKENELEFEVTSELVNVIMVEEGSILTGKETLGFNGDFNSFLEKEGLLKLYVKDRYNDGVTSKALVAGFGNLRGAIASTVAHDSHNVIAVGNNFADISRAINLLIEAGGGISFVSGNVHEMLTLPVGGLMSNQDANYVAQLYGKIIGLAKEHGCILNSPLMTLSFLALPVIPSLKITDKGLFDVDSFSFTNLFV